MKFLPLSLAAIGLAATLAIGFLVTHHRPSPADALNGQRNTTLTFYGKVVDQDGNPLSGAVIEYRVESYPKDWTFETRGADNDVSHVTFTSGQDGKFQYEVSGCTMRRTKVTLIGYQHFAETKIRGSTEHTQTEWYRLIAQGNLWYKSDPDHPAVYVFVKDGVKEVSALPCHGGYSSGGSLLWRLNEPGWPTEPSLKDVIQKPPTPAPSTLPSTRPGVIP